MGGSWDWKGLPQWWAEGASPRGFPGYALRVSVGYLVGAQAGLKFLPPCGLFALAECP